MQVEYTIDYRGAWISLNKLLSMNRWKRSKLVEEAKVGYQEMLLGAGVKYMQTFQVSVRYRSRINDDPRYFSYGGSTPDMTLKHNQYVLTITGTLATEAPTPAQPLVKPRRKSITK